VRIAALEMHPIDGEDRTKFLKETAGLGLCNITKCCTEVCPEGIHITDNAIIPLKERVVDRHYDFLRLLWNKLRGSRATRSDPPRRDGPPRRAGPCRGGAMSAAHGMHPLQRQ
jgi:hypothetical protein